MLGAAGATGMPRCRSMACLAKAAAWAELPRAAVTTTRGGLALSRRTSAPKGPARFLSWRATASGASRISVAIWEAGLVVTFTLALDETSHREYRNFALCLALADHDKALPGDLLLPDSST